MEQKFQTSFIPKKPVTIIGSRDRNGMSLLLLVSVIVFLISLGLAGWVFLEKKILIQQITSDQDAIEKHKSGLTSDSLTIESLIELDSRINVAKDLLSKHISVSPLYNFLQRATLKSVRFKNFSFSSASGKKVSVQMSGVAKNWETVASQADEFGKAEYRNIINEPKISNLSLGADGSVSFLFSAYIMPEYLVYVNNITD